ncbi:MAG: hypothetical protein HGA31_04155 [Candidatus Moranbacteria bacterium]|nr:hypothetical protein [Candidatus Moranbacteria bacterium]
MGKNVIEKKYSKAFLRTIRSVLRKPRSAYRERVAMIERTYRDTEVRLLENKSEPILLYVHAWKEVPYKYTGTGIETRQVEIQVIFLAFSQPGDTGLAVQDNGICRFDLLKDGYMFAEMDRLMKWDPKFVPVSQVSANRGWSIRYQLSRECDYSDTFFDQFTISIESAALRAIGGPHHPCDPGIELHIGWDAVSEFFKRPIFYWSPLVLPRMVRPFVDEIPQRVMTGQAEKALREWEDSIRTRLEKLRDPKVSELRDLLREIGEYETLAGVGVAQDLKESIRRQLEPVPTVDGM